MNTLDRILDSRYTLYAVIVGGAIFGSIWGWLL